MPESNHDRALWDEIVARVAREWQELPGDEQKWIREHVLKIVDLQERLHRLFLDVDGAETCRTCHGDCCGHGKYHPTLVNLLACLVTDHSLPDPDFTRDCPYIDSNGCLFPPGLRPYNCISFICEQIEACLPPDLRERFYLIEREIRAEYELFASRYVGAGMRGILIRGKVLSSFLTRC